jgi:hypothetical protein
MRDARCITAILGGNECVHLDASTDDALAPGRQGDPVILTRAPRAELMMQPAQAAHDDDFRRVRRRERISTEPHDATSNAS